MYNVINFKNRRCIRKFDVFYKNFRLKIFYFFHNYNINFIIINLERFIDILFRNLWEMWENCGRL